MLVTQEISKNGMLFWHTLNQRERVHSYAPSSNISLIARIRGRVSPSLMEDIIRKMQKRHPILNACLQVQGKDLILSAKDYATIPIKVISRVSNEQWKDVILKEHKIPFDITHGPLIRFILLSSEDVSDLILFCQHVICDGMSLAYLARDIMVYLGDPGKKVEILPEAPIVEQANIPGEIKPSLMMRLFGKLIQKKWDKDEVIIDIVDFNELHKVFWDNYDYKVQLYEMSKQDTEAFIQMCRKYNVTVNTALMAAFAIAQNQLHLQIDNGKLQKFLQKYAFAMDIRKLLVNPVGEQFGFFAGGVTLGYKFTKSHTLWKAAKIIFKEANREKATKKALVGTLDNFLLPSTFIEAQFYAVFGRLVPPNSPRYDKMQRFVTNEKNIAVKMANQRLKTGLGLAQIMTNLGRIGFPEKYGDLKLENLILMPSCSPYTELVLGVVTHGGTLSITLNHMESTISTENILQIKKIAHGILMKAIQN